MDRQTDRHIGRQIEIQRENVTRWEIKKRKMTCDRDKEKRRNTVKENGEREERKDIRGK